MEHATTFEKSNVKKEDVKKYALKRLKQQFKSYVITIKSIKIKKTFINDFGQNMKFYDIYYTKTRRKK